MGATPNRGFQAAALQKLGVLVKEMESLIPMLGVATDEGKAVYDALGKLAKFVPSGSVTPASQRNVTQEMMQRANQNGQMQKQLDQQRAQGGAGGQPPQQPGQQPGQQAA